MHDSTFGVCLCLVFSSIRCSDSGKGPSQLPSLRERTKFNLLELAYFQSKVDRAMKYICTFQDVFPVTFQQLIFVFFFCRKLMKVIHSEEVKLRTGYVADGDSRIDDVKNSHNSLFGKLEAKTQL